jgi:hypothetical protein
MDFRRLKNVFRERCRQKDWGNKPWGGAEKKVLSTLLKQGKIFRGRRQTILSPPFEEAD